MLFALPVNTPWSAPEKRDCLRAGLLWGRVSRKPGIDFSPLLAWVQYLKCNRSLLRSSRCDNRRIITIVASSQVLMPIKRRAFTNELARHQITQSKLRNVGFSEALVIHSKLPTTRNSCCGRGGLWLREDCRLRRPIKKVVFSNRGE